MCQHSDHEYTVQLLRMSAVVTSEPKNEMVLSKVFHLPGTDITAVFPSTVVTYISLCAEDLQFSNLYSE